LLAGRASACSRRTAGRSKERADEPDGGESYAITEFGKRIFEELVREPDAPIKSFARASWKMRAM
jgi:hypothetical protein